MAELHAAGEIEWSRAITDSTHVQAKKGARGQVLARSTGAAAAARSISSYGGGLPLAWTLTGGNRNDFTQLLALLDAVPPVRGRVGRPRRRPGSIIADRGYDHDKYRRLVWQRGVKPLVARRQIAHGSGLGRERWVVERTFAWLLNRRRRLLLRTDRRHETHEAFLSLACCVICWRRLESSSGRVPCPA